MALKVKFLAKTDRRKATTPFCESEEEWWESLPGYSQNQIQEVGLWAFKLKR